MAGPVNRPGSSKNFTRLTPHDQTLGQTGQAPCYSHQFSRRPPLQKRGSHVAFGTAAEGASVGIGHTAWAFLRISAASMGSTILTFNPVPNSKPARWIKRGMTRTNHLVPLAI